MNLRQALRLSDAPRLALVGSGGKTSALFLLCRQFMPPVILTATTHLAESQAVKADRWIIATTAQDVVEAVHQAGEQVLLITGPPDGAERLKGVDHAVLEAIRTQADRLTCPLLIEADGSRRLPLKAPAAHEPAIPAFCNQVVVVAGMSAIGNPLAPEWVHRVERYSELSGLRLSDAITLQAAARVLLHPEGGLKNIPAGARRVVMLNQAETIEQQSQAGVLGKALLEGYDSIVVAALSLTGEDEQNLDRQVDTGKVHAVYERIGGIILAAGGARRFGEPKLLMPWRGEAIIRHVVKTALDAGLDPVLLVAGEQFKEMGEATADLNVRLVHNPDWEMGQSSSMQAGLRALPESAGGAVFFLGDMPQIPASLARSLVETHSASLAPIVAPLIDGQRGNPVLFDRQTFPDLMKVTGDVGGRPLFAHYPVEWVPWHDSGALSDIDTPDDYWRLTRDRNPF